MANGEGFSTAQLDNPADKAPNSSSSSVIAAKPTATKKSGEAKASSKTNQAET